MRRVLLLSLIGLSACAAEIPRRIVSMSPNLTEIIYGIGAFDRVVGVSDYCTYPPAARKLPSVGAWHNPNLEKLAVLHPDLVIVDDGQSAFVADRLDKLRLPVLVLGLHTIRDVYAAMETLGRALDREADAARLAASTQEALRRVSNKTASLPKLRVTLIVDRAPGTLRNLNAASERSYLGELIQLAGGTVAAPPFERGYGQLSKEELLVTNPDFILDCMHASGGRFGGDPLEPWQQMPELKAVKNGRVRSVNQDFVPHASQRIVQTAELFARIIHPEAR
ncbi:MAG: hypothetical protein C5B51_20870 [Terriglobia bacterium]|nr:MAG: hypothetical protein C5B51_20870 [Terriglobia bacterium]